MKRTLLPIVFCFFSFFTYSQSLFDVSVVHEIEINFYDSNWDHLLDSMASEETGTGSGTGRILAEVIINGTPFDSCGVRYKGNSSMDTTSNKNPYNIDLNYVIGGQEYQGKDKIKLANCFTDPSMVREALTYEIGNRYMDCPKASFTRLIINGNYIGIYTNTESIDNEFLSEFYGSSKNPFFKCDPISFDIYGDNSNLAYHPDTIGYDTLYDMKSDYGTTALQELTYQLEFNASNIDQYLDVDRALWFLALSSALVHNDGYTAFAHNFYVYKQDNGRWSIILWDVNMSFGGLLWNGTNFLPVGLTDLQEQDPFIHESAMDFRPLIARLLSQPKYKKMYVAHYKTILEENIANGHYLTRAEEMSALIDADRQIEPYNEYTYTEFQDNLYDDVGSWINLRPGLQNLMEPRLTYLNGLTEFQFVDPGLFNESTNPVEPDPFTLVTFNIEAIATNEVYLGYRHNKYDVFTKTEMFDDGNHNDGTAGDGVYGVDVVIQGTDMQYYFYAENANAARFSPARAEYEFYTLSPKKGLVINEISASNATIAADLSGDYDDWVELYNASDDPIAIGGYHLSDENGNLIKWQLPNFTLQPGAYFIVWCDNQTAQSGVHANFKLSANGEGLYLSDDLGFLIDYVEYPTQYTDITYGRLPNGTGPFNYLVPTFGAQNDALSGIDNPITENEVNIQIYPNPAKENVVIKVDGILEKEAYIYDLQGRSVLQIFLNQTGITQVDISQLAKGTYVLKIGNEHSKKLIVQ
ncbi:MAG: CotH kinase family protein [Crocinitomicaceae bacterium]